MVLHATKTQQDGFISSHILHKQHFVTFVTTTQQNCETSWKKTCFCNRASSCLLDGCVVDSLCLGMQQKVKELNSNGALLEYYFYDLRGYKLYHVVLA